MSHFFRLRSWFPIIFISILLHINPIAANHVEHLSDIHGVIQNGTKEVQFQPSQVSVTLHVLEGISEIESYAASLSSEGMFRFKDIEIAHSRTYFLTVEYQGAIYSASVNQDNLDNPSVIQIFESTEKATHLNVISHTLIVTGAEPKDQILEILERISLDNAGDKTVIANTSGGSMQDLLRFALPPQFYNLDIRSDLVGGEVLIVDRGFALTTPVPPSQGQPHHFEFIYRLKYSGTSIDLSRTLRFGADNLRVVIPVTVATGFSNQLTDLGIATIGDQDLQLLEGSSFAAGTNLELRLNQLPEPSIAQQTFKFIKRWQLTVGLPILLGTFLGGTLIYGLKHKGAEKISSAASRLGSMRTRDEMFKELIALERYLKSSEKPNADEQAQSESLKQQIMALDIQEKFDNLPRDE